MGRNATNPPLDRLIGTLAERQHGVVSLSQLRELGLSSSAVRGRAERGRLYRLHRGAYAVGYPQVSLHGRRMAAVLACGPGAALSHRSAAAHRGLRPGAGRIEVTVGRHLRASRAGIDLHRSTTLAPTDVEVVRAIPCTSVARTLLDLAEVVGRRSVERAVDQAEVLRVFDPRAINDVLDRANGRRGAAALRAVLAEHAPGDTLTRSELEERFLALSRAAGVPRPRVNAWIALPGHEIQADFVWERRRLIVETDGHGAHGTRAAFERDRTRDRHLLLAGWRVVRFTWRQVVHEPDEVIGTLAALFP